MPLLYSIPAPNCGYLIVENYEYRHTSTADGYTGHFFAFTRTISGEGAMGFSPPLIGLLHRNDNVPCVLLRHLLLIDMRTLNDVSICRLIFVSLPSGRRTVSTSNVKVAVDVNLGSRRRANTSIDASDTGAATTTWTDHRTTCLELTPHTW